MLGLMGVISFLLIVAGLFFSIRSAWPKLLSKAIFYGFPSLVLLVAGSSLALFSFELSRFHSFSDQAVATVSIKQNAYQDYALEFTLAESNSKQSYSIYGDEWRLDARMVFWHSWLPNWLFKPLYQLDRVEGRYAHIQDQLSKTQSVYSIQGSNVETGFWSFAQKGLVPGLQLQQGAGIYVPMKDGAIYTVYVEETALRVRAGNEIAQNVLKSWERPR